MKFPHPFVFSCFGFGSTSEECVQVTVVQKIVDLVMWRLASCLNTFGELLIKSFDPNFFAQRKTVGTRDHEWRTAFHLGM
jgi:hypothetical protein